MSQSATVFIDLPPSAVYDYVMDVPHDSEWRTGVVEAAYTSDEPRGVGTTGYDKITAYGRDVTITWTVFEHRPGRLARWTLDSGPMRGHGGYICEAAGDGTSFTLEADVKPVGWYRLLGPLFGMVGRRHNQADVQKLKAILEGER